MLGRGSLVYLNDVESYFYSLYDFNFKMEVELNKGKDIIPIGKTKEQQTVRSNSYFILLKHYSCYSSILKSVYISHSRDHSGLRADIGIF